MSAQYPMPSFDSETPRLTKRAVEGFISHLLGYPTLTFVFLDQEPASWKHACLGSGVTLLAPHLEYFYGQPIVFAFCPLCGRVHYTFSS